MPAHPELLLLSAVVRTKDHKTLIKSGVTPATFTTYPDEAEWLFNYISRHRKTPSKVSFKNAFPATLHFYAVDDVEYYCNEVKQNYAHEGVMQVMDDALNFLSKGNTDKAMRALQQGTLEVHNRSRGLAQDFDAFEDWKSTYAEVAGRVDRVSRTGYAGVPTGFDTLDTITGGLQPGWLTIIGARLGVGKTWTGIRMGFSAAVTNHRVLFYSLEQNKHQVAMRLHNFASASWGQYTFNSLDLNRGHGFDLREYKKFLEELKDYIGTGKFFINDSSRGMVTPMTVANGIELMQPDVVFIDYLTLMGTSGDDWRATAKLSAELQNVCQRYDIPIAAMSQVNRLGIGKEPPNAENLSQADAIGQDADLVVTMAQRSKRVMKMKIAKFRHGPTGATWNCHFGPGSGKYEEITGDEADDLIQQDSEVK